MGCCVSEIDPGCESAQRGQVSASHHTFIHQTRPSRLSPVCSQPSIKAEPHLLTLSGRKYLFTPVGERAAAACGVAPTRPREGSVTTLGRVRAQSSHATESFPPLEAEVAPVGWKGNKDTHTYTHTLMFTSIPQGHGSRVYEVGETVDPRNHTHTPGLMTPPYRPAGTRWRLGC